MNPRIVILSGPREGDVVSLENVITSIGRQDGNDLQILEPAVSRRHGEIRHADGAFTLHDRGSTHGTFINGRPVHRQILEHGDLVQIGPISLVFLRDASSGKSAHPRGATSEQSLIARSTLEKHPAEIAELMRGPRRSAMLEPDLGLLLEISTTSPEHHEDDPPEDLPNELLEHGASEFLASDLSIGDHRGQEEALALGLC